MPAILRISWVFSLLAVMWLSPAAAVEAVCKGKNLLNVLKLENPKVYAEIAQRASRTTNGDALLWKIEGNGAPEPSYLLGTLHLPDPRVVDLSPKIKGAVKAVSTVALELTGTDDQAAIQKELFANPALMVLQGGKTLWQAVDEKHHAAVEAALKTLGMSRERAANLQPWLPSMMLALSPCFTNRTNAGKPGVDQTVEKLARAHGKTVIGLETAIEQFKTLSGLSLETQAIMLADSARTYARIEDINETLVQLYLQRKIGWILPFGQQALGVQRSEREQRADREFIEKIMSKRNHLMDERAQEHLAKGGLLIAVGALHLPGESGLVNLLRKRGFSVTKVD